jgi:nucleoside recognition membrane protein YjiH
MTNNVVAEDNRPLLFILYSVITIFCFALSSRGIPDSSQLLTGNACCDSYVCFSSGNHSDINELFVNELVLYYKTAIVFSAMLAFYHTFWNNFDVQKFDFTCYQITHRYPYIIFHLRKIRSVVLLN